MVEKKFIDMKKALSLKAECFFANKGKGKYLSNW